MLSRGESPAPLWEHQAAQWSKVAPPLRPSAQDLGFVQETVDRWGRGHGDAPAAALILGVTPELVGRTWPSATTVVAADRSMPMIRGVGRSATEGPASSVIQADWMALPLADGSFDLVFGDGSFNAAPRSQALSLACSIRRALKREGMVSVRVFVRPESDESSQDVWACLLDRQFGSFGIFKFRLLMSLCRDGGDVTVADAWDYFYRRCPSPARLATHLGWPMAAVATIEAYRGQQAIYWFPTAAEFRAIVRRELGEAECACPSYEMGDRCPTFVFAPPG